MCIVPRLRNTVTLAMDALGRGMLVLHSLIVPCAQVHQIFYARNLLVTIHEFGRPLMAVVMGYHNGS